jgi:adenylate cyclase
MGQSFIISRRHLLLHSVAGIAVALLFWSTGLLSGLEARTYDLRASLLAGKSPSSDSIVLVAVDQQSIDWVAGNMSIGWPWPRELFAAVIVNCIRRGAEAIGFDVLFTEHSNFGLADDLKLKNAILQSGHFALGSVFPSRESGENTSWPADVPRPDFTFRAAENMPAIPPAYERATFPVPEVTSNGIVLANVQHRPDPDGIYRSIHPLVLFDGMPLPALGLGVFLSTRPDAEVILKPGMLQVNGHDVPLDGEGEALLNFRQPEGTYRVINAASVIREEFRLLNGETGEEDIPDDLAGKYVLFGYLAPGLHDLRPSPVDGAFSGVEINATLLDNLLSGDFIRPVSPAATVLRITLLSLAAVFILSLLHTQRGQVIAALFLPLVPVVLALMLYRLGYDFKLVPIELGVITAATLTLLHRYLAVGRQERFIRHSFKHYLSPVVIDHLLENPEKLRLGGERKELSVFFSDLEGFTAISEGLGPEDLTSLLNDYLTEMTEIILEEQGTVDKFEGDAIIAFWNAPLDVPNHAELAVRAALRCQQRLARIRPDFLEEYGKQLNMRIGINTGHAVAGNMGSSSRFDYTVLGDAVNLAARLEGANKEFGTGIMISEATMKQLGETFHCRELGRIRVVGRGEPVRVYEPLSFAPEKTEHDYHSFARGLELFYAGRFADAEDEFLKTAARDRAAARYAARCRELAAAGIEVWEGVWEMTGK